MKISQNIFWLGSIQVINYGLTFILVPILLARVGLVNYGNISLALGLTMIFVAINDFGFNLTGSRAASLSHSQNDEKTALTNILSARILLIVPILVAFTVTTFFIEPFRAHSKLIFYSFPLVITHSIFPGWYFTGKQKTNNLSLLTLLSRLIYFLGVITFVHDPEDSVYVNLWSAAGWFLAFLVSFYYLPSGLLSHSISHFNLQRVLKNIFNNTSISLASLLATFHRSLPIIIAGAILSPVQLGIYSVADKVILAITSVYIVLYNSIFPKFCASLQEHNQVSAIFRFMVSAFKPLMIFIICGSLLLLFFGSQGLALLSPELTTHQFDSITPLIALIPFGLLMNLPIGMTLVAAGLNFSLLKYHAISVFILVPLCLVLGKLFYVQGIILSILITEYLIFIAGIYLIKQNITHNQLLVHD